MDPKENLENTKEIKNLDELRKSAIDTLELTQEILEELDENMEFANTEFETKVELQDENVESLTIDKEEKENHPTSLTKKTWKEKFKTLKEKWSNLSKPKKIGIIIASMVIIALIILAIVFLLPKKQESSLSKEPDVIIKENNYRYENGTLIFLDKNEKEIGKYECKNKEKEKCYVAWNAKEDDFDEPKQVDEEGEKIVSRTHFLLNQYAFVYDNEESDNGLITLYDFTTSKVLDTYALVKEYPSLENQVILKNKANQYGLYQLSNDKIESIIPNTYDYLGIMENNKKENNKIVAKRNNKWYLIDFQDKTLTKAIDYEIKDYNESQIKVKDEQGLYHLVDYNNVNVHDESYEYIDLIDNYILWIKDQKMLIEDTNNHKMHLNAISLYNQNYLPVSTYDTDQKHIKTEKSYEISYQGNIMKIEVQNSGNTETQQINLNEGRISATLDKMDYFDGVLYFYEDAEKKNSLGSYSCSNKNTLGDETTELNNCKIAKESFYQDNDLEKDQSANLGTLPIYNKRFAFIEDGTSQNSNIVLYDLKTNETKARYKSVDAGAYTKNNQLNLVTTNGNIIIAESQNNKYGAIKIDYENVNAAIGFNYTHLERIGFYYLAQDASGYYLIDQNGTRITEAFANKIANYNDVAKYVTRKSGSEYFLYPFDGKGIGSGQSYIALYDTHYATVSNNTLKLFSYRDSTKDLLEKEELPTLKSQNYQSNDAPAFKISIYNQIANIEIAKEDGTYETFKVNLTKTETKPEEGKDYDSD